MKNLRILAFLLAVIAVAGWAVKVEKIDIRDYRVFQKGTLEGTQLDSRGYLSLGPEVESIKGPEAEFYLTADLADDGSAYVGTGHQAQVFRINRTDGSVDTLFTAEQPDVYALKAGDGDSILVATSPNGKLFRVEAGQEPKVLLDPDDKFIWDIARDRAGRIYCVTGNSGGVYRIAEDGQAEKIFTPDDAHLITLTISRDNALLVGSGDRGIVYHIKDRKTRVLYDSPLEEVRGICQDARGDIYFAATRGMRPRRNGSVGDLDSLLAASEKKRKPDNYQRVKSVVYRMHADGTVEEIWTSSDDMVYAMAYDETQDRILIGTGHTGRVYSLDRDGSFTMLYECESAQVFRIIPGSDGFLCVSNNTARLSMLKHSSRSKGSYISDVFDMRARSRMGRLVWEADSENPTAATFFVRAGNSSVPDATWTEWSPPFSDPQDASVNLSGYRFVQIKSTIAGVAAGDETMVGAIRLYYVQSNVKPRISRITVKQSTPKEKQKKSGKKEESGRKRLSIQWKVADVNDDTLKYNLFLRKLEQPQWFRFKKDLRNTRVGIDPEMFEDGRYVLRLVVDDSLDNAPGTGLSDEKISHPFILDSTAPVLSAWQRQGQRIRFTVADSVSPVARVLYTFDGTLWYALAPVDGITDSRSESFDFSLQYPESTGMLFIKVMDSFGNTKVFQKAY